MTLNDIKKKFISGNSVPVESARLSAEEFNFIMDYIAALESEIEDLGYEAMEANERHDC